MTDTDQPENSPENHEDQSSLEGSRHIPDSPEQCREVLEQAFDYRGDVTLELDDATQVEGYIYDRDLKSTPLKLRLLTKAEGKRMTLTYDRVKAVTFSGKDAAHGKSWETWIKKAAEKKARGEAANLYADSLED